MFFTERSAAEFISGDTEGGRPPGRRHLSTGNGRSVRTSHSGGSRSECAGAAEAGHAWCRGNADVLVGGLWQIVRCDAAFTGNEVRQAVMHTDSL